MRKSKRSRHHSEVSDKPEAPLVQDSSAINRLESKEPRNSYSVQHIPMLPNSALKIKAPLLDIDKSKHRSIDTQCSPDDYGWEITQPTVLERHYSPYFLSKGTSDSEHMLSQSDGQSEYDSGGYDGDSDSPSWIYYESSDTDDFLKPHGHTHSYNSDLDLFPDSANKLSTMDSNYPHHGHYDGGSFIRDHDSSAYADDEYFWDFGEESCMY